VNCADRATLLAFEMMSSPSLIGCLGRVTASGSIRPGRVGEVMLSNGGGVQAFLACDADGGAIDPYEAIVVVEQTASRTVLVTRLYPHSMPDPRKETRSA
jgi:hypothetical protein